MAGLLRAAVGTFNDFWLCSSGAAPGTDCFGTAQPAVRYNSPTWGGFRFETSYGNYDVVPAILDERASQFLFDALYNHPATRNSNFWDIAVFYTADWNSIKLSAAYAYTDLRLNPLNGGEEQIHQVGGPSCTSRRVSAFTAWASGNRSATLMDQCAGIFANRGLTVNSLNADGDFDAD